MPFPADYGGVVDVYYKLKALHDAGVYVILHTFIYGREMSERIKDVVDEVYYYPRTRSLFANISFMPFIVRTRCNSRLMKRILSIDAPVILEGLHTCGLLDDLKIKGVRTAVRTHNIEHDYYNALSKATSNPFKKLFYKLESLRLKRFESVLSKADIIFPLSESDKAYFEAKYPDSDVKLLYPFFNDSSDMEIIDAVNDVDILYHGNLDVIENRKGLEFIIDSVLPLLDRRFKLTVAGHCSLQRFVDKMLSNGIRFVNHPTDLELNALICCAKVNLFVSFQSTGVKLKLLNALSKGNGVCIVNSPMVTDDSLRKYCIVADSAEDIASEINKAIINPLSDDEIKKQRDDFSGCFSAIKGVNSILENL